MNAETDHREAEILTEHSGSLGLITLNRPKALNSLNLDMVRGIEAALDEFEYDVQIAALMVSGAGERGLCAGGDIRMIYESGKAGTDFAETFWREEYRLNARISHFSKPYIAVLDGITMGGGVGISAHGSHRIATDRLRLAMPETGIGFFPDVGASWILSHAPGELGTYLGLTGEIIGAADAIAAGFADVMVPNEKIAELRDAVSSLSAGSDADRVSRTIATFVQEPPPAVLTPHHAVIDRVFAHDTVEAIVEALESDGGEFAAKTLVTLKMKSPTALKVALRMLLMARGSASLEQCLDREFIGAMATAKLPDFYEGVRAAVIDKDRNPRWAPAALNDVGEAQTAPFFAPQVASIFG